MEAYADGWRVYSVRRWGFPLDRQLPTVLQFQGLSSWLLNLLHAAARLLIATGGSTGDVGTFCGLAGLGTIAAATSPWAQRLS